MPNLTDATSYADAQRLWSSAAAWELFDGDRAWFNIGHECVDRHVGQGRTAIRLAHADGRDEALTFEELAAASSRVAHWLEARGVRPGDRVALLDRKSGGVGKRVSVRVDIGGRRIINKQTQNRNRRNQQIH